MLRSRRRRSRRSRRRRRRRRRFGGVHDLWLTPRRFEGNTEAEEAKTYSAPLPIHSIPMRGTFLIV
jgi:hypothetical protein